MVEEMFATAFRQVTPILIIVVIAVGGLAILKSRIGGGAPQRGMTFPYEGRPRLFTATEARFLQVLREAVPQLDVYGKVRLEDVVQVRGGLSQSERQSARNRIKSRHLDFVITDPASTRVLCAVELDDASHSTARARHGDSLKDGALAAAGVPLVRMRVESSYDVLDVRHRIEGALNSTAVGDREVPT